MTETENWLIGLAQKGAAQRSAVMMQDDRDPGGVAESLAIGEELGVPAPVVEADPDGHRRQLAQKRASTALSSAPKTQAWLADPTNAGLAKDDTANLSAFETFFRAQGEGLVALGDVIEDSQAGRGFRTGVTGTKQIATGIEAIPSQLVNSWASDTLNIVGRAVDLPEGLDEREVLDRLDLFPSSVEAQATLYFYRGDADRRQAIIDRAMGNIRGSEQAVQRLQGAMQAYAEEQQQTAGRVPDFTDIGDARDFADWFAFNTGQALPYLAVTALAGAVGGPVGVGASGYAMGVGDINAELLRQDVNRTDLAFGGGVPYAALEFMGPAAAPFRNVSRAALTTAAQGYFRRLGREIPQQAIEEFINEAGQEIVKSYAVAEGTGEPVKLTDEQLLEWFNAGMAGAASGGAMAPLTAAARPGTDAQIEAARQSGQTAERLAQLDQLAGQSQVRQRSVERFEAALKAQGGEAEAFFVPAEEMREYFQAKDVALDEETLRAWGVDMAAFEEAAAVGGDVSVPASAYTARISGTDDAAWVADHARLSPDEMSAAQAREFNERVGEILEDEARQQSEEEAAALEERADDVQVREEVFRQLRQAGRSPDVAAQEAEVFTAFLRTMADRTGEPLLDLSRSMPVLIQGPFADEARRRGDLDRRLNALRRDPDRAMRPRGDSLLDFIRSQGGISDVGGDVAAMDPPRGLIAETREEAQARASQATFGGMPAQGRGLGLDDLASAAEAEGYFPDGMVGENPANVLLEAIRAEIAGEARYIPGQEPDPATVGLYEELNRRGVDLAMTNDQIVEALEGEGGREFGQPVGSVRPGLDTGQIIRPVAISRADGLNPQAEARAFYKANLRGSEVETVDGTRVRFTAKGEGKAFMAGEDPPLRAGLAPHLPDIVRSAVVYGGDQDARGRPGLAYVYAASAVEIDGEVYPVRLVLRQTQGEPAFYEFQGYEMAPPGRTSGGAPAGSDSPLATPAFAPGGAINLGQAIEAFNGAVRFQDGKRASIVFPRGGLREGETVISLFESANLSSFIHEAGHYFLEAFALLAEGPDGTDRMREDLGAIREWLGLKEGEQLQTEHHEKWARGFEAYALEGKAPSLALADAFSRFKAWLTRIYRTVRGLDVKITPEIREVMDRMLATDAEIAAARDVAAMDPMFKQAPPGMSEGDFGVYARMARRSQETAEQALLERTMAKVRREREAWWKAERKAVKVEVEDQINRSPVYRAAELMANGRWWRQPEDEEAPRWVMAEEDPAIPADMRLDRKALVDRFGEGVIEEVNRQKLGGKRAIYVDGGVDPREAAEFFGFDNSVQMVEALQNAGKRADAIEVEVARRMDERHGDPLTDGSIEEEALRVIHNDQQAKASVREMRYLAERLGRPTQNMQARVYRQRARAMLGRMTVAEAIRPRQFLQAERKAARAAQDAFAQVGRSGGREALAKALQAKEQQVLNGFLYDEARKIEAMIESKREHMRELGKRKVREKIGQGYIEQIDAILEHFDFRRQSGKKIKRRENLRAFMERMKAEGRENNLNIDPRLIDDANQRHYTRLSVGEIRGVFDTIENIEYLGRFKEKLIEKARRREEAASAKTIIDQVTKNSRPVDPRAKTRGRQFLNLFRSPDTIMIALDGGDEFGPVYEELKRGIDEGAALEQKMAAEAGKRLDAAFSDHYSRAEVKALMEPMQLDGLSVRREWTKAEVLALALNSGNQDNYQRLLDENVPQEYRLTRDELQDLLSRLDDRDWRFVQRMWDEVNRLWPDLAETHRRRSGVVPKKVEAQLMVEAPSFVTGGYYPLKYDPAVSVKAERDERSAFDDAQSLGWGAAAAVGAGMTKERAQNARGRPVLLDLSVAHRHIRETARYIALSEPVDNAWRLLNREDVGEAMKSHGHNDTLATLRLWLQDTAMGPVFNQDFVNATARALKNNFTMSKLAFNMKTVALQVTGLGQSAAVVGKKNLGQALITYGKAPRELSAEVVAKSPFMAERETTFQKDIFDMLNEGDVSTPVRSDYRLARDWLMRAGMWAIQKTQFYTVDMPTWLAGYRAAVQDGADEATAISRADRLVARSQSSGLMSDRSAIERGTTSAKTRQSDFMKLFTTLGSYMIAKNNRAQVSLMQAGKGVKESETALAAVAPVLNAAVDLSLLFAFEATVMGIGYAMLTDEEDDDEVMKYIAAETALSPLAGMPFVRDMTSGLQGFGTGGAYGSIGETLIRPIFQVRQGEVDRAMMRSFADLFGLATGFPSTFAFRLGDAAVGEGTPAEALFGSNPLTR